jgi:hypothetical protein
MTNNTPPVDAQVAERCETCRFGQRGTKTRIVCRRLPPVGTPLLQGDFLLADDGVTKADLMAARTAWPVVNNDDWCGEYQRLALAQPGGVK